MRTWILYFFVAPFSLLAVSFTGQQTGSNEWTYTLTYAPQDNYSIFQPDTTITIHGLFGVFSATEPSSTDFPFDDISQLNLNWTAEVLDAGTGVRWTHAGPGTGNFPMELHVIGFRVYATGATNGPSLLTTSGFALDGGDPSIDNRDIVGLADGPGSTPAAFLAANSLSKTNGFALTVLAIPGYVYRLQAAASLPTTNWAEVLSFRMSTTTTNLLDTTATNIPAGFYRVVSP